MAGSHRVVARSAIAIVMGGSIAGFLPSAAAAAEPQCVRAARPAHRAHEVQRVHEVSGYCPEPMGSVREGLVPELLGLLRRAQRPHRGPTGNEPWLGWRKRYPDVGHESHRETRRWHPPRQRAGEPVHPDHGGRVDDRPGKLPGHGPAVPHGRTEGKVPGRTPASSPPKGAEPRRAGIPPTAGRSSGRERSSHGTYGEPPIWHRRTTPSGRPAGPAHDHAHAHDHDHDHASDNGVTSSGPAALSGGETGRTAASGGSGRVAVSGTENHRVPLSGVGTGGAGTGRHAAGRRTGGAAAMRDTTVSQSAAADAETADPSDTPPGKPQHRVWTIRRIGSADEGLATLRFGVTLVLGLVITTGTLLLIRITRVIPVAPGDTRRGRWHPSALLRFGPCARRRSRRPTRASGACPTGDTPPQTADGDSGERPGTVTAARGHHIAGDSVTVTNAETETEDEPATGSDVGFRTDSGSGSDVGHGAGGDRGLRSAGETGSGSGVHTASGTGPGARGGGGGGGAAIPGSGLGSRSGGGSGAGGASGARAGSGPRSAGETGLGPGVHTASGTGPGARGGGDAATSGSGRGAGHGARSGRRPGSGADQRRGWVPGFVTDAGTGPAGETRDSARAGSGTALGLFRRTTGAGEAASGAAMANRSGAFPGTAAGTRPGASRDTPTAVFSVTPTAPRLLIRLLGGVAIEGPGGRVDCTKGKDLPDLLGLLAVHRDGLTREKAHELLWPDVDLSDYDRFHSRKKEIRKRLHRALADGVRETVLIKQVSQCYFLNADLIDVDYWRLTEALSAAVTAEGLRERLTVLRRAADLYTGPFLPGSTRPWSVPVAEDLRRSVVRALTTLIEHEHDATRLIALLDRTLDLDPCNEPLRRRHMRLHADLGRIDEAHRSYRRLVAALDQLGGLRPSPLTTALYRDLAGPTARPAE